MKEKSKRTRPDNSFGTTIEAHRVKLAYSASTLAARAGFTGTYWREMERGHRPPPPKDVRERIYAALDLTPEEVTHVEDIVSHVRCSQCDRIR